MDDITPQYTCSSCQRGVLNRRVERCIYCDELLPPGATLSAEEIAALEAQDRERSVQARRQMAVSAAAPVNEEPSTLDVVETAFDVFDIISDVANFID